MANHPPKDSPVFKLPPDFLRKRNQRKMAGNKPSVTESPKGDPEIPDRYYPDHVTRAELKDRPQ